ncbi:hypothetical protein CLOM_g15773 [Closterium sp. NIES-68]|nr:hypothetical protein CLOM_g15773 [Closterium sp. NIES-68]GJP59969.1 hypothetical protein CLOP_g17074 [Closterium sp. NIES-67]GJP78779.1 hypothetical protein CLOP_g9052 [Closterium sp. NIES-67]
MMATAPEDVNLIPPATHAEGDNRAKDYAHVRLPRDAATGRNKGYCFVHYASDAAARRAAAQLDRHAGARWTCATAW